MSIEKNTKNTLTHEDGGFTTILNETIQNIRNQGALGIYCYLASKPSGWEICKKHLQNHFECGRDKINTNFKYLKSIGAIEITVIRNEKGQCVGWNTQLKRKIPAPSLPSCKTTEIPRSTVTLKTHNSAIPESGDIAPIKKEQDINKGVLKKTKQDPVSVSVFSDTPSIQNHITLILSKRKVFLEEDTIDQIIFYIGKDRNFDSVAKKINIALKKIREGKWNIPQGWKGITSQSIIEKDEKHERERQEQIQSDAVIGRNIAKIVLSKTGSDSLKQLRLMTGASECPQKTNANACYSKLE